MWISSTEMSFNNGKLHISINMCILRWNAYSIVDILTTWTQPFPLLIFSHYCICNTYQKAPRYSNFVLMCDLFYAELYESYSYLPYKAYIVWFLCLINATPKAFLKARLGLVLYLMLFSWMTHFLLPGYLLQLRKRKCFTVRCCCTLKGTTFLSCFPCIDIILCAPIDQKVRQLY